MNSSSKLENFFEPYNYKIIRDFLKTFFTSYSLMYENSDGARAVGTDNYHLDDNGYYIYNGNGKEEYICMIFTNQTENEIIKKFSHFLSLKAFI